MLKSEISENIYSIYVALQERVYYLSLQSLYCESKNRDVLTLTFAIRKQTLKAHRLTVFVRDRMFPNRFKDRAPLPETKFLYHSIRTCF